MKSIAAVFATLLGVAHVAHADNSLRPEQIPQRARELAEKGRAFHDAGDYARAIVAFKEAYVLAPSPGLLFNLAQAYRLAGNCDDAAWMYRRFLDTNPGGDRRAIAETHLATVDKCKRDTLGITLTPAVLETRVPEPASSDPFALTAQADDVHPGERQKKIGMWTAIGGGVALLGAGYFALDASDAASTVEEMYAKGAKWKDIKPIDERGQRSATIAKVLGIGGLAAAATGGVFYYLGYKNERARHVSVSPSSSGAEVSLSWAF